ncbi:AAA family ATPase [bacterium]|nr:AAA family ATPase [bacterium]
MHMIPRKLSTRLVALLKNRQEYNNVILLEGARQVGKTTLVRKTLESHNIPYLEVNLEEKKGFSEKIDQCEDFDEFSDLVVLDLKFTIGDKKVLFIDEAQESKKLGGFVRFMKEKWNNTQVILTGSSMARIFRDNVRFPVGRVTFLHLFSLSFIEFLEASSDKTKTILEKSIKNGKISNTVHSELINLLQQYMNVGGLPEVVTKYLSKKEDWHSLRHDLLFGYYNDFKRVFGEEKQPYFIASMEATADLLGQPFKNSHVSRLLDGGKNDKIIESLSQLEAWKILFKVSQNGPSPTTNFHPKRYLFDLGLAKQLRESSKPHIDLMRTIGAAERTPLGGLIENATLLSLIENYTDVSGWKKSSSGSEVDFIIKKETRIIPFECKSVHSIKNSHLYGLRDYMEIYNIPVVIVVSLAPLEFRKINKDHSVLILPLYLVEYWEELLSLSEKQN